MTYFIIGCLIGGAIAIICCSPKIKKTIKLNTETITKNILLKEEQENLSQTVNKLSQQQNSLNESIKQATEQFKTLSASLEDTANSMYEQSKQIADSKMQAEKLLLKQGYDKLKQQLELDYELKKNETAEKEAVLQQDIKSAENRLAELTSKVQGAIEAARRQEELESNLDFYRVTLTPEDENEIKAFLSIEHLILNKRSLKMFLWSNYYSKRVNELAARVLGANVVCGIYKITNIQTQQIYIGQATDCRERFRQHCKTGGCDIDRPTTNKLYSNMVKYGLSNFTFELMEKCSREELDSREKHWITFYQSNVLGLNSQSGNGK